MDIYMTARSEYQPQETPSDTQKFFDSIYGIETEDIKREHSQFFFRTYTRKFKNPDLFHSGVNAAQRGKDTLTRERNYSDAFMREHPDLTAEYDIFHIPKKSGGLRTIAAPKPNLKTRQREIKHWLDDTVKVLPHDCAFAYVQHRTGRDALIRHQRNNSKWFLKIDLQDFFPSMNSTFVLEQLMKNASFNRHGQAGYGYNENRRKWGTLLQPCFLNDALPQGAVTSPLLTNLVMVPLDFEIAGELFNYRKHRFIYTRYADDMLISCKEKFDPMEIVGIINQHLEPTPLRINDKKTRFGSSAGSNWNLGMMLNSNNDITIGHKRKARFRSILFSFLMDCINGRPWSVEDTRKLDGEMSWFASIEPDWMKAIVKDYEKAYAPRTTYRELVKAILNP